MVAIRPSRRSGKTSRAWRGVLRWRVRTHSSALAVALADEARAATIKSMLANTRWIAATGPRQTREVPKLATIILADAGPCGCSACTTAPCGCARASPAWCCPNLCRSAD